MQDRFKPVWSSVKHLKWPVGIKLNMNYVQYVSVYSSYMRGETEPFSFCDINNLYPCKDLKKCFHDFDIMWQHHHRQNAVCDTYTILPLDVTKHYSLALQFLVEERKKQN